MRGMPTHSNVVPLAGLALRCQPDSRLVVLVREGRERAFEEIVRRYRGLLVSFAAAIVPDHRADDVVQDSLTKAHDALLAGDAEIKLKPWLYTIVRNRAFNDLRDQPTHEHLDESFDGVPQPPEVAAGRAEFATLVSRMKDLPSPQREALVKRELEGRSHAEIAGSLGVTPGAVRGLIFRARMALRNGAGMLIPMPVVRALLHSGSAQTGAAGTGIGGATAGLTAGGGGVAVKAGTTLAVAVLALGSGIALRHHGERHGPVTVASGGGHHRGSSARLEGLERRSPGSTGITASDSRSGGDSPNSQGARGSDPAGASDNSGERSGDSGRSVDGGSGDGSSGDDGGSGDGGATTSGTSGEGGGSGTSGDGGTSGDDGSSGTSDGGGGSGDGGSVTDGGGDGTSGSDGGKVDITTTDGGDLLPSVGDDEGSSGN